MSLLPNTVSEIKSCKIRYDHDVTCTIEKYVGTVYYFCEELISLFEQYEMVCYHSTKILNKNIILSTGLTTNERDTYSRNIYNTLQMLGAEEKKITEDVEIIKKKYEEVSFAG